MTKNCATQSNRFAKRWRWWALIHLGSEWARFNCDYLARQQQELKHLVQDEAQWVLLRY